MKKLFTILATVAFVATLSLGTTACSKKSKIIGDWEITKSCDGDDCDEVDNGTLTFDDDGTFEMSVAGYYSLEGKWTLDGDVITMKPKGMDKFKLNIQKLDGKKMVLKNKKEKKTMHLKKDE